MTDHEDLEAIAIARLGSVLLGKYRLERLLGIGGMASVYAATHRNQAEFAVKMLHAALSQHDHVRTRFLREGYIANSVKHPGAVRVVDDDVTEDGSAFLVMELLHGASVEDLWFRSERLMPLRAVMAIGYQLLDVLAAAHDKTIVHRDIKPANLFVTVEGDLKVLDFGIARLRDATGGSLHATTQSGMMLGTPAFMAPEQALGKSREVDGRTDIWAVGATLFTLVSGSLVHEAETAPQLLVKAAITQARPLSSVAPDVPPVIAAVLDRALAFDKAARWQSAAAMRDALRDAYVAAFDEALTAPLLAAYYAEMDAPPAPPVSTLPPPEGAPVFPEAGAAKAEAAAWTPPERASGSAGSPVEPTAQAAARTLVVPTHPGPTAKAAERAAPVISPSGLTTSQPVSTEPAAAPPKKKRPAGAWLIGGALALTATIGGVALMTSGGHEAPSAGRPEAAPVPPAPSASGPMSDGGAPEASGLPSGVGSPR